MRPPLTHPIRGTRHPMCRDCPTHATSTTHISVDNFHTTTQHHAPRKRSATRDCKRRRSPGEVKVPGLDRLKSSRIPISGLAAGTASPPGPRNKPSRAPSSTRIGVPFLHTEPAAPTATNGHQGCLVSHGTTIVPRPLHLLKWPTVRPINAQGGCSQLSGRCSPYTCAFQS